MKVEEDFELEGKEGEVNVKTEKGIGCEEEECIDIKDEEVIYCEDDEDELIDIKEEVSLQGTV